MFLLVSDFSSYVCMTVLLRSHILTDINMHFLAIPIFSYCELNISVTVLTVYCDYWLKYFQLKQIMS